MTAYGPRVASLAPRHAGWTVRSGGLTPREHASAGKPRSQGISRQGDRRLRTLFALGASTLMRNARAPGARATAWQRGILARRPVKVAVLAQAVKTARMAVSSRLRSGPRAGR